MSTVLDAIAEIASPHGLALRKAIPRGPDHLLLVFERADGSKLAGQWYADPVRAAVAARETRESTGDSVPVPVLADSGVLLQPDGADRRMPGLHLLATAPGATLVAHRPERRAMVRHLRHDGQVTYTKVVRPDRLAALVARADVHVPDVSVPQVTAVDVAAGTMTCTELPGRTFLQLLDDPAVPDREIVTISRRIGEAVARLHAAVPPADAGHHDAAAEAGVVRRWLDRAAMYGVLDAERSPVRESLHAALRLLAEPPCDPTYLHRDLHEMQVLVDEKGEVGMIDFDLATTGEPALDLANLLVHLELHGRHQRRSFARSVGCAEAVVEAYAPDTAVWRRVPAYALATRLRLAAVNAFRPRRAETALSLLTDPAPGPLHDSLELT